MKSILLVALIAMLTVRCASWHPPADAYPPDPSPEPCQDAFGGDELGIVFIPTGAVVGGVATYEMAVHPTRRTLPGILAATSIGLELVGAALMWSDNSGPACIELQTEGRVWTCTRGTDNRALCVPLKPFRATTNLRESTP